MVSVHNKEPKYTHSHIHKHNLRSSWHCGRRPEYPTKTDPNTGRKCKFLMHSHVSFKAKDGNSSTRLCHTSWDIPQQCRMLLVKCPASLLRSVVVGAVRRITRTSAVYGGPWSENIPGWHLNSNWVWYAALWPGPLLATAPVLIGLMKPFASDIALTQTY